MFWIYDQKLKRSHHGPRMWVDGKGLLLIGVKALAKNWFLLLTVVISGAAHGGLVFFTPPFPTFTPEVEPLEEEELEEIDVNITTLTAQPPPPKEPQIQEVLQAPPPPQPPQPQKQFDPATDNPLAITETSETEEQDSDDTSDSTGDQSYTNPPPVYSPGVPGDDLLSNLKIAVRRELDRGAGINDMARINALFDSFPEDPPDNFDFFASGNSLVSGAVGFLYISQIDPTVFYYDYLESALEDTLGLAVTDDSGLYGDSPLYKVENPDASVDLVFYISLVGTDFLGPTPSRTFLVIWAKDFDPRI